LLGPLCMALPVRLLPGHRDDSGLQGSIAFQPTD
jgi:hypothetical protein